MRDPFDGKPYYCLNCDEPLHLHAVGEAGCDEQLPESAVMAQRRAQRRRPVGSDNAQAQARAREQA